MTVDARALGDLMMLGVRGSEPGDPELELDLDACASVGVRGVILFDRDVTTGGERNVRDPDQVRRLVTHLTSRLGDGTIVAIDQEGGCVRRLGPGRGFGDHPSASEFARLDPSDQREGAKRVARELSRCGIGLNFAPCVDLAIEPENPIIAAHGRSFGESADAVAACAEVVIGAHLDAGVACCLKHFPGHGSTRVDSHLGLPDITASHQDSEIMVFERLIRAHKDRPVCVMTGHLLHRGLDPEFPASLSRDVTTSVLRERLGFDGVVVTDAIDMDGVRARWSLEETIERAIGAGADLIVHACNSPLCEYAPDVVRAIGAVAGRVDGERARRSRARLDTLRAGGEA